MSSPTCAHLHVHSEYSLLDGACKIDGLAARAAELGQPALGLTDHGVMNGAVELYKAARKHGIKPVVGCEIYLVDDRKARPTGKVERNHLTLLAATDEGYRNLVHISSAGFLEGLHRGKPTVDMELLDSRSDGIIALTGCLASRLCSTLVEGREQAARDHLDELFGVFGPEQVYFEVQKNGLAPQDVANEQIVRLAREHGRPLVATADVHYLRREDHRHHAALLCVQTKSTLAEPKMSFETNEFFLKSNEEMAASFAQWPAALETSLEIAERCTVDIELGKQLIPSYPTPDGRSEADYLRGLVADGLRRRYGDPPPAEAIERMDYELGVIDTMGFNAYFLIVWDFVSYAKGNGIAVGPGRGSAAGSIVSYCLAITDVDPLRYDLLFERFLNPERVSMPDIDIDFSVRGREDVIRYVTEKYGKESVAQIVTFGRMFPRAATRDAARVLGHDYQVGDKLAKLIPDPIMGRPPSFDDCLKPGQELAKAVAEDAVAGQIVEVARGLEGIVRNSSIHAAAVVIADRPLTEIVPLQLADAGTDDSGEKAYRTVTQFSMKPIEEIGLLKMDFLGLRNLDVIESALDIIERSAGSRPDMVTLALDDEPTYAMLSGGDSIGVFQFESEGMREALRKVRPTEFEDLVALVALYRPGAMDQIPTYARGKREPESVRYPDDRLRPITGSTKGVIIYQEQSMQIAKTIAGFSGAKADDLRKAIGKKNHAAMAELKPEFFTGAKASGTSDSVIEDLWTANEKSADYSFNKCASSDTRVVLPDGRRLRLSEAYRLEPPEIMAMWSDGQIRPHRVQQIVRTGRKALYRVRCASGRQIKATLEHRLLTTAGYLPIGEMSVGTELITMADAVRCVARPATARRTARRPECRGYAGRSVASNGMWCASTPERAMCEWLIEQGVEFEMHKVLANGRICDFYFAGIYWEMDGMDRTSAFFADKYGDLPYIVVTPEDFGARVAAELAVSHAENGDPIVSIEPLGYGMTYDVEMAPDGPLNFLANGIVSHNSHAACYALISYRTAWLKANHPAEYMAALISSVMDTKDKVPFFVAQTEEMGIEILPPDVNVSDHQFVVVEGRIRFGLDAVKGVGFQAVEAIKAARQDGGPFESLWDFCARVDPRAVNKRSIEALVKCGAFGTTGASRKGMLSVLEQAQAAGQQAQQDAAAGQGSIFDLGGEDPAAPVAMPTHPPIPSDEFDQPELLAAEKESLGLFISAHPLKEVREALAVKADCSLADLSERRDGDAVTVGGIITESKKIRTRKGDPMMFATLGDLEGTVELVIFGKVLAACEAALQGDSIVLVRGRVDHKDASKTSIVAQSVDLFTPTPGEIAAAREKYAALQKGPEAICLRVDAATLPSSVIDELKHLLENFPGESEVVLEMDTGAGCRRLRFGTGYRVAASPTLHSELHDLLGAAALSGAA